MGIITSYERNKIDRVWFPPRDVKRILHALSTLASGFEENTQLLRLNECRLTSESKQSVFSGFSSRYVRAELTRNDKGLFNASNSTKI